MLSHRHKDLNERHIQQERNKFSHSNVFVLNYSDNNKVFSCQLDYINRAGTSNAILRDVLGIDSTLPIWAEKTLNDIVTKYSRSALNNATLAALKQDLTEIGLSDYIPVSIARVVEENNANEEN